MATDSYAIRDQDLRRWRSQFPDTTPIADLTPRHPGTCVGVVNKIRVVPGRSLEVTVVDGTGQVTGVWSGRSNLPGLELGGGLRLHGTVAKSPDGSLRILNPSWEHVTEPYS